MGISGSDPALTSAISDVMRAGATRSGYVEYPGPYIEINGTAQTKYVDYRSIVWHEIEGSAGWRSTLEFIMHSGSKPTEGHEVKLSIGSTGTPIFAGHITNIRRANVNPGTHPGGKRWLCRCVDKTYLLNKSLVYGYYAEQSSSVLVATLVDTFAGDMTRNRVIGRGPDVGPYAFNFVPLAEAIQQIADDSGWHWYVDAISDVHFYDTEKVYSPEDLTESSGNFWDLDIEEGGDQIKTQIVAIGPPTAIDGEYTATYEVDGKADSGTDTTLTDTLLGPGTGFSDDYFNGGVLEIYAGTNEGEARDVTDFDGTAGTATVSPAFTAAVDNTSRYRIRTEEVPETLSGAYDADDPTDKGGLRVTRSLVAPFEWLLNDEGTGTYTPYLLIGGELKQYDTVSNDPNYVGSDGAKVKRLVFVSGTLTLDYAIGTPVYPVMVSESGAAAAGAIEGGDGVHEFRIDLSGLPDMDSVETVVDGILTEYSAARISGAYMTRDQSARAGGIVTVNLPNWYDHSTADYQIIEQETTWPESRSLMNRQVLFGLQEKSLEELLARMVS